MPSIANQNYIIIDWGGKDSSDAAKKAEVDAILKNAFLANPLSMFSIVFKDYGLTEEIQGTGMVSGYSMNSEQVVVIVLNALDLMYDFSVI